jgi:effector-binding domain-containing protein
MKALKIILYIVIALVVIVFGLSFIAPTKMHVERTIVIKAPKEVIFKNVKMFSNNKKWSPWEEKDSNIKTSIEGTDGSVGAMYKWVGNKDVGEGEQTIRKIDENRSVETDLHFIKPWESHAVAYTNLDDTSDGVKVSWGFNGEMSRPFNIMGLFMNMDRSIGGEYEKGLAKLKALSEKEAANGSAKTFTINEVTVAPKTFVGIKKTVTFDKISPFFAENFPKIFNDIKKAGLKAAEPVSGLYYTFDEKTMTTEVAAVAPVMGAKGKVGECETFNLKGGKALEMDFYGDYKNLGIAHNQIKAHIAEKKMKSIPPVLEEYITDPMNEKDPAKWLTKIYYFVE